MLDHRQLDSLQSRIENEIAAILENDYGVVVDKSLPIRYYVDFRWDKRLIELRHALERMDDGDYGACGSCGGAISVRVLEDDPATQLCKFCANALSSAPTNPERQHRK